MDSNALFALEAILLAVMIIAHVVCAWLLNKLFKIREAEYNIYSNASIIVLLGIVLSFMLPETSYIFGVAGLVISAIMFVDMLLKNTDVKKWRPILVPFVVLLPLTLPLFILVTEALGPSLAVFTAMPVLLTFSLVTPYIRKGNHRSPQGVHGPT